MSITWLACTNDIHVSDPDKDLDQWVFHPLLFNLMSILLHIKNIKLQKMQSLIKRHNICLTHFKERLLVYKYNILERVLVENIIPRNVIINRGAAEVDNYISRDDFSTSTLSRMLYLFYYTEHHSFIF